jgi:hypothetical protein
MSEKPFFAEGEFVRINLSLGQGGFGTVCGRAYENIVDIWIVRVSDWGTIQHDPEVYPWSCITIPGSCLEHSEPPR